MFALFFYIRTRVPSGVFWSLGAWTSWVGCGRPVFLSSCLLACLLVRLGGSRAADPPFAWERGKGEPSDPPSDPPQRRPTPATHPRSYRHVAGVRYTYLYTCFRVPPFGAARLLRPLQRHNPATATSLTLPPPRPWPLQRPWYLFHVTNPAP